MQTTAPVSVVTVWSGQEQPWTRSPSRQTPGCVPAGPVDVDVDPGFGFVTHLPPLGTSGGAQVQTLVLLPLVLTMSWPGRQALFTASLDAVGEGVAVVVDGATVDVVQTPPTKLIVFGHRQLSAAGF